MNPRARTNPNVSEIAMLDYVSDKAYVYASCGPQIDAKNAAYQSCR